MLLGDLAVRGLVGGFRCVLIFYWFGSFDLLLCLSFVFWIALIVVGGLVVLVCDRIGLCDIAIVC